MPARLYLSPQELHTDSGFSFYRNVLNGLIDVQAGHYFSEIDHPFRRVSVCNLVADTATHAAVAADSRIIALSPLVDGQAELEGAIEQVVPNQTKTDLEAHGTPTEWMTGATTIRQALRMKLRLFLASQRMEGRSLVGADILMRRALDDTVGSFTAQQRTRMNNILTNLGVSTTGITLATTIRQVLQRLVSGLQWDNINLGGRQF